MVSGIKLLPLDFFEKCQPLIHEHKWDRLASLLQENPYQNLVNRDRAPVLLESLVNAFQTNSDGCILEFSDASFMLVLQFYVHCHSLTTYNLGNQFLLLEAIHLLFLLWDSACQHKYEHRMFTLLEYALKPSLEKWGWKLGEISSDYLKEINTLNAFFEVVKHLYQCQPNQFNIGDGKKLIEKIKSYQQLLKEEHVLSHRVLNEKLTEILIYIIKNRKDFDLALNLALNFKIFTSNDLSEALSIALMGSYPGNESNIIKIIMLINELDFMPLKIAKMIPVDSLKKIAEKQGMHDLSKLELMKEMQARVVLAHSWGISGKSKMQGVEFELEGSYSLLMSQEFKRGVEFLEQSDIFDEQISRLNKKFPGLSKRQISNIIRTAHKSIRNIPSGQGNIYKISDDPNVVTILPYSSAATDKAGHAIGLGLFKNYLFYANRGFRTEGERDEDSISGIKIFRLTNPQEFIKKFNHLNGFSDWTKVSIKKVENFLEQYSSQIVETLNMKEQSAGNCSWASTKALYIPAIYFSVLRELEDSQKDTTEDLSVALPLAYESYKYFSAQKRRLDLEAYLNFPSPCEKDHALIFRISLKSDKKLSDEKHLPVMHLLSQHVSRHECFDYEAFIQLLEKMDASALEKYSKKIKDLRLNFSQFKDNLTKIILKFDRPLNEQDSQKSQNARKIFQLLIECTGEDEGRKILEHVASCCRLLPGIISCFFVMLPPVMQITFVYDTILFANFKLFTTLSPHFTHWDAYHNNQTLLSNAMATLTMERGSLNEKLAIIKLLIQNGANEISEIEAGVKVRYDAVEYFEAFAAKTSATSEQIAEIRNMMRPPGASIIFQFSSHLATWLSALRRPYDRSVEDPSNKISPVP